MDARVSGAARPRRKLYLFLLCLLEVLLLVIVCSGLLDFKFENRSPGALKNLHYSTLPKLTGWDDERLQRQSHETDMEYATRMNVIVGSAFHHCNYATQQNIFEIVASFFIPTWKKNGFLQASRNCGFCHQAAYILARVLNAQGIDAIPLGMNGHVCVLMKNGNEEYIFDPDFVVGPMIYQEDMTPYILELYKNQQSNKGLYKAFATNTDDRQYDMKFLNESEAEQSRILKIVKGGYYFCIVSLVLNTLLIIVTLRRGRWQDTQ